LGGYSVSNFDYLAQHDERLRVLATLAERYFSDDPNTCQIKLRQFAEALAQEVAARGGIFSSTQEPQVDLLRRLSFERLIPRQPLELFHHLRKAGNQANHGGTATHSEALTSLKVARELAIWFHRTFAKSDFKPGPFTPPTAPVDPSEALAEELNRLRADVADARTAVIQATRQAEVAEQRAAAAETEARAALELAAEAETEKLAFATRLSTLQSTASNATSETHNALLEHAEDAAVKLDLDEKTTRELIDAQLRAAGWEADTAQIRYSNGVRPAKGMSRAIAEWPTASGPADYALFVGETLVATIEAKRRNKNCQSAIGQAERYARDILHLSGPPAFGGPWNNGTSSFKAPFAFATNGRPYLKQIATLSGVWFRDVRRPTNISRALSEWYTPNGLMSLLETDRETAHETLRQQPFDFGFQLRPYQKSAIEAVEKSLESDTRQMLVAMATGTGKTKLAIALLYRLISAKRFRRVCFVVDRSALGTQTKDEFTSTRVVTGKTFAQIFGLKGLEEVAPDSDTRVHICTIQGLVKRVLYPATPEETPPIDQYDLILVDECHRGYLLDREMSDQELSFRNQADYVSKYRRVLEHFDAVRIGLTATPAVHTRDIFGDPIYTYSYREAVIDGHLIDHEPPIRIVTALAQAGIEFKRGEAVDLVHVQSGEIEKSTMPDDIDFEVDQFNRSVVTVPFNKVVATELARQIDPSLPGKTLIFAVNRAHADILVDELKKAFEAQWGEVEDAAVRRITGDVDQVGTLIKKFRNDPIPKVAVTVDLLTTGIDVPSIVNLVFMRRVNSRILYEQMIGRATRQCEEIGKDVFRIFDAVDLYANLQHITDMKPVAADPKRTLSDLFEDLVSTTDNVFRAQIRDEIIVKMRRRIKKLSSERRDLFTAAAGATPAAVLEQLRTSANMDDLADWARARPKLGPILDWTSDGSPRLIPISQHPDEIISVEIGYGEGLTRPEDFIDSFTSWIKNNINTISALRAIVQRPRELTRKDLRNLRLELDKMGFTDAALRSAWTSAKNQDIAASIIGFIRQAAIGDPLIPYSDRVRGAIARVTARASWTGPQRDWLRRIGEAMIADLVVDREALYEPPFDAGGGFNRLNRVFDGRVEAILADINEELWSRTA
jgi:type I restriction enzyme, R subunit